MNTYFRILAYAKPYLSFIPQYIIFTLIMAVFSVVNIAATIPLLDTLFGVSSVAHLTEPPVFDGSIITYASQFFDYYMGSIIASYGKMGALYYVCGFLIFTTFVANLFRYLSNMILAKVKARIIKGLRNDVFDRVTQMHLGFFSDKRKGDIMSRITNDVQEVEASAANSMTVMFKEPMLIIGYFVMLFYLSPKLTFICLLLLPIAGLVIAAIVKSLRKEATASQESLGRITNILDETLGGMRIIKAFNAGKIVLGNFAAEVTRYAGINISMAKRQQLASPTSEFLGISLVAGLVVIGGMEVLSESPEITASQFIAFMTAFSQMLTPAKAISKSVSNIQRGLAAADRIFLLMDTPSEITDAPDAIELTKFESGISYDNISFAYENETVLDQINLEIKKGQTVALVGPSGGGKSTLADLLPRFYDPIQGEIRIDGVPIKKLNKKSLRSILGIVTQESILFNDSIANNIAFGEEATRDEIINAAKIANAHEFISEMESGYDTNIGERGGKLSGGQRQRLSIARAVLKNPAILILDEATSALDSESEKLVQGALTHLMENRTSLVIAHRLSTIQHADVIVVIQKGQIVEMGSHEELLQNGQLYHKLIEMQSI